MILPFVRELFADVETSPILARAIAHTKGGAGRLRVSGLTSTAKALFTVLLQRCTARPLILMVSDNRAIDELLPVLRSFAELTGTLPPESVGSLPAYDVLPFENQSPHPEIQEERAASLWKIATGAVSIVVTTASATAMRMRGAGFYAGLAKVMRRGEMVEVEKIVEHLRMVGYSQVDVVEMPGEFAHRGGLLDVYPPESDRPIRIEFFGDEVESIRKFDPATQRSAASTDDVALLPLTETPLEEETLAAISARLSGQRIAGSEEMIEQAVRATGVTVFPGWELYAPVAGADETLFDLLPNAQVLIDEPEQLADIQDAWWTKVEEAHERSLVGNLVRPEDLYLSPEQWNERLESFPVLTLEQLGIESSDGAEHLTFQSQPTTRFHGSIAAVAEEVGQLAKDGKHVIFAVSSLGEVERLADAFNEYNLSFRIGSRTPKPGQVYVDESSYFSEEIATTTIVKAYVPEGVVLPDSDLVLFGSRDLFDEADVSAGRPQQRKSKSRRFFQTFAT